MRRITDRVELEDRLKMQAAGNAFKELVNRAALELFDQGKVVAEVDDEGNVALSLTEKGRKQ